MSQDKSEAVRILSDPKFAANLKRWNNERKIRNHTRGINFARPAEATKALHELVKQKPQLFYHDKILGKTAWEICNKYYNKLASYVR